ncbi:DUF1853 family protein [uncultured Algibacter sp.]|uniref:DUF1853 family protein n=1 Tax=uncultured Algibacter sp. TaxID=298659 RepID=UPI00261DB72B|nr:DUF1853 family protein [uncultured Algibacter sp.]
MINHPQKRYEGFLKTPYLWQNDTVFGLNQFELDSRPSKFDILIEDNLRLGKYIERLVSFELQQQKKISILAENVQIQKDKLTLGELDCLLLKDEQPIHLEIIYKFYLYDDTGGNTEIEHFIGPNRKDSLIEKLNKLKEKQLPLIYSDSCKPYLDKLGLRASSMSQQVYFKAQLFVPFSNTEIQLRTLNNDCIVGFYINQKDLENFTQCKFYIPVKKDWLITPHKNIKWLNFNKFKTVTKNYFEQHYSTLFWIKFKSGTLKKVFLVWW